MEIEGTIVIELPMMEGIGKASGRPWKKREWVLETSGMYPRKVKIDAFNDRADSLNLQVGNQYAISIEVESREYNGRWYTEVHALSAHPLVAVGGGMGMAQAQPAAGYQQPEQPQQTVQQPQAQPFGAQPAPAADPFGASSDSTDDLPF